ncbi:MAG: hypothetical protein PVI20_09805 [Desulfobacteraceae bacterium]|jgi:hypothetical protein
MKKVLAVGATPDEEERLRAFCQENQWDMSSTPHIGRKQGNHPIHNVLEGFNREMTVAGAARFAGVTPGTAYRILKKEGKI